MSCPLCSRFLTVVAASACVAGCSAPPAPPARSAPAASATASTPPASSPAAPRPEAPEIASQPVAIPQINHATLPNGLNVWHVGSRTIPTVHVRLVVRSGLDRPAVARLTAYGVEQSRRAAPIPGAPKPPAPAMQAEVGVRLLQGAAVFSLDAPADLVESAFEVLGSMVRLPRLDAAPIAALRTRDAGQVVASLQADPASVARDFAAADLIGSAVAGSEDLSRILPADLKAFHKTWYTPRTMGLVVAGDVTFDEAMEAARRAFGSWEAPAQQPASSPAPSPTRYTRVVVIDRPQAADAAVVVAAPGAPIADAAWPSLWLLQELIGDGTPAARCSESASDLVSARGAGAALPLVACFHPAADKVSATVGLALERTRAIARTEPTDAELQAARSAWNDRLATSLTSLPALADFAASALAAGMDHDAPSKFVAQAGTASAADVREAARSRMAGGALVVVAADAARTADELSRYGDVVVVDPSASFARKRQIPANPQASAPAP